jgi:hypothetical protein
MKPLKHFTYGPVTARVESDEPEPLVWLEEFLTPSFTSAPEGKTGCTVALVEDDRLHDETLRRGPRPGDRKLDCFSLDRGLLRLPSWNSDGAERVLFDEDLNVFYFVDREPSSVRILARPRRPSGRIALMRATREFAMSASWTGQSLIVHGAALELGNAGIVIAGPKRAGKTSLLIHLLHTAGARFVANDRAVVDLASPEAEVRGMPTVVTVRSDTLDLFSGFGSRLLERGYDHCLALGETGEPRPFRAQAGDSVNLTPAQFCSLLGSRLRGRSPLRALLFPRVTDRSGGIVARELSPRRAASLLAETLFARASLHGTSEVFATASADPPLDRPDLEALCRTLAAGVRSFECALGRNAYEDGTRADFLGSVLESEASARNPLG